MPRMRGTGKFLERGSGQSCGILLRGQDKRADESLPVLMRWRPLETQQELFQWQVEVEADGSGLRRKWEVRKGRQCVDSSWGKFGCEGEETGMGLEPLGSREDVAF